MSIGSILVVDDEPDLRSVYELALVREGYGVDTAGSVGEGKKLLETHDYDVMITDMRLPDGLGLELVQLVSERGRSEKCLVVTAYGSAENAVEALKAGAFDYLTKPVNLKQLRQVVAEAIQSPDRLNVAEGNLVSETESVKEESEQVDQKQKQESIADAGSPQVDEKREMLGSSAVMQQVRNIIKRVSATMAPVLIQGESGTGKELVAKAIHNHSHRANGPFVAVNCGAIPENLVEAEFFGYRKGSFTGANEDRVGLFASAGGGTLFLDEIGELPLSMQAKLLRVIQERAVRPLGAHEEESIDVRIVSATHRNLASDVGKGRFRQDLYYRLNVIEVLVPPLRERAGDIFEIAQSILERICHESSLAVAPIFEEKAKAALKGYAFPGNVRELENVLQRAVALSDDGIIYEQDLMLMPAELKSDMKNVEQGNVQHNEKIVYASDEEQQELLKEECSRESLPNNLSEYLDNIEREKILQALEMHHFNRTAAATQLGMTLRQIRYRMERLNIEAPEQNGDA